jgi:hypothetical protein
MEETLPMNDDAQQDPDFHTAWLDACFNLSHWLSLGNVAPEAAAALLCGWNPDDCITTTPTDDKYQNLRRLFEDRATVRPAHRSFLEWIAIARESGFSHRPEIEEYLDAIATKNTEAATGKHPDRNRTEFAPAPTGPAAAGTPAQSFSGPPLKEGPNSRASVEKWVVWQAQDKLNEGDTKAMLAERICRLAEKNRFESVRGTLTTANVIRMLPKNITGGRGKNGRAKAKRSGIGVPT